MNLGAVALLLGLGAGCAAVALAARRAPEPAGPQVSATDASSLSLPVGEALPRLDGASAWLNVTPAAAPDLRGKVVLVNFWTYSCINSLRQIPYVRAWYEKYRDHGLVVVGVHAPEFGFEHDLDNVRQAVRQSGVDYPVAMDNHHRIWDALDNQYWPALYFVDARGHVRHLKVGEGDYATSERILQQLLREAGASGFDQALVAVDGQGAEAPADWGDQRSPESYLGYARSERLASPGGVRKDRMHDYAAPPRLALNQWALAGTWSVGPQAIVASSAGARIVYRFHARDLHLVLAPAAGNTPVRFRVTLNGGPPGAAHGADLDAQGNGVLTEARMYQLIRQPQPIVDRQFEIEFIDPGAQAFAFTFG
ncbi:MAG TPA: redoxin domain-containing protein [Stenotrophomonas sp.]|nr:redoxin domain-containing protein [Stenotrophomonas sp.]